MFLMFLFGSFVDIQAQTAITVVGTPVTQDFDGLASSGSGNTWTDNSTLPGWYAYSGGVVTAYSAADGSASATGLYSFGVTGSSDRALGFVPAVASYLGWLIVNNTTQTIETLGVTWYGEQWSATSSISAQTIQFHYKKNPTSLTDADYTQRLPSFSTLVKGSGALNGNNYTTKITSYLENVNLAPGETVMLRWYDASDALNMSVAIDNIEVNVAVSQTITFSAIPNKVYGAASFDLDATASSGLPVTYSSSNTDVATISGNTVTIVGAGQVTITAAQEGNTSYKPASSVERVLNVYPDVPELEPATGISQSGFTANWHAYDGLNSDPSGSSYVYYTLFYSKDPTFATYNVEQLTDNYLQVSGLESNSVYYYRLYASHTEVGDGGYTDAAIVTTGTDYISTANGTWDQSYWDVEQSPGAVANKVTVLHDDELNVNGTRGNVVVNTLELGPGASLDVKQQITVAGTLIINVDKDDDAGQLLNNSNIIMGTGSEIIIKRTFDNSRWHFVGFPFDVDPANIFLSGTTTQATWGDASTVAVPYKDFYVRQYNGYTRDLEGTANYTESGLHWEDVSPHGFVANKGYILAVPTSSDITLDFVTKAADASGIFGSLKTISVNQYKINADPVHWSWNLVTQPFASSYDLLYTNTPSYFHIFNYIKLQNRDSDNYDDYSERLVDKYVVYMPGDQNIVAPYLSFFIQAPGTTLSFNSGGNRALAPSVDNSSTDFDEINLKLEDLNTHISDNTRVRLQEGASDSYILGTEAVKMFSESSLVPQIYTKLSNGYPMSVNMLPATTTTIAIPTKIGVKGEYSISLSTLDKVENYSQVLLVDNQTATQTDLLMEDYTFDVSTTGTANRFKVILVPNVTTNLGNVESGVNVISANNSLQFTGLNSTATVSIYDLTGKKIEQIQNVISQQMYPFAKKGLYLFEINENNQVYKIKAIVK